MQLVPYLNFDGTCAEAFRFYAETLGGTIVFMQTMGESPMAEQTPPEHRNRVMHVNLRVGDSSLYASDSPPGQHPRPAGFAISINVEDVARGERIFNTLAEGGQVQMPFDKTYWAERFGMLVDRYGTPWMVNAGMFEMPQS